MRYSLKKSGSVAHNAVTSACLSQSHKCHLQIIPLGKGGSPSWAGTFESNSIGKFIASFKDPVSNGLAW